MWEPFIIATLSLGSFAPFDPPIHPRWMPTGIGRAGVVHVPIWISHPIDDSFAIRARQVLSLSEAQVVFLDTILRSNAEQDRALRDRHLPELRARSISLGERGSLITQESASAEEYASFVVACKEFNDELARIERGVFTSLLPALTAKQAESMGGMEDYRARQRYAVAPADRFATRVDLADLILEIEQTAPLQRSNAAEFDALLESYEAAMTHVARLRSLRKMESMQRVPVLVAANAREADDSARSDRFSQIDRLARAADAPERRIRDLNNTYVDVLADLLLDPDAERFRHEYLSRAYPEVWPNPFDVSDLISTCARELPPGERVTADSIALKAGHAMAAVSDEMRQRVDKWLDQLPRNGEFDPASFEVYKREMDDLQARRRMVAETAIASLRALWINMTPPLVDRMISEYWMIKEKRQGRPLGVSYVL